MRTESGTRVWWSPPRGPEPRGLNEGLLWATAALCPRAPVFPGTARSGVTAPSCVWAAPAHVTSLQRPTMCSAGYSAGGTAGHGWTRAQTHTDSDSYTDTHRHTHTRTQTHTDTHRLTQTQTQTDTERHTRIQTHRLRLIHRHTCTQTHTDSDSYIDTHMHTDSYTQIHRQRQTHTETDTHT